MKIFFKSFRLLTALVLLGGLAFENRARAATAFVYDTGSELLTSADFNNDSISDVLVVDKLTGNLRVGLLDGSGNLSWSAPLVSGVENATACAIGQFLTNEGYAMTFEKGNPLVACVNQALAAMKADGTLKSLTDKSFPGTTADIPVFK